MNTLFYRTNRQQVAVFLCCATIVSLVFSRFALSLCMIFFVAMSLFSIDVRQKFALRWNPDLLSNWRIFVAYRPYLVLPIFFLVVLVSGLWSEELPFWAERLRIRLPFLFLPFAFASLPRFSERQFFKILYFLLCAMSVTTAGILINYALNFRQITELVWHGQPIPMPTNHIRFSLLLAFTSAAGIILFYKNFFLRYPREKWLILLMTIFCIVGLHLLSVRSGVVSLYMELILLAFYYAWHTRRWVQAAAMVVTIALIPILAYYSVPAFEARVEYMKLDAEQYQAGGGSNYSDSERIISIKAGIAVGNQNPILGVGTGDLMTEMKKVYHAQYAGFSDYKIPHNQWVMNYASTGLLGVLMFAAAFFLPIFYQKNYKNPLFSCFYAIIFLSFMVEATLETSVGTAFFIFFLLLGLHYFRSNSVENSSEEIF